MADLEKKVTKEEFIQAIMDNTDRLNNIELAKEMGIHIQTFYRYQKEYKIKDKTELREYVRRYIPELIEQLRANARKGSDKAIQLLMEITGVYTPANKVDMSKRLTINYNIGNLKVPEHAGTGKLPNQPRVSIESSEQK